jgi:GntR family transcriptional regulator/MocR family aminotransferase
MALAPLVRPLRRTGAPLHEQLYLRVRDAVLAGSLAAGSRLPSSRALALDLGVARGTVDLAYARLAGEGYLVARGAAGTRVAEAVPGKLRAPPPPADRAPAREPSVAAARLRPFAVGMPSVRDFPSELWGRLVSREQRRLGPRAFAHVPPEGQEVLREAVAGYLAVSRGVACHRSQVWITSGYQGALGLLTRALLASGDVVAVEDPGYARAREAIRVAGLRCRGVPVDGEGLDVEALARRGGARAVVVTPAHQMPLGVSLSLRRRLALLEWARAAGAWIVEDDYDGEFHYDGRPLPALKSLDRGDRVLYAGTFSKSMFPALRLGYLVVPEEARPRVQATAAFLQPACAAGEQRAVAAFLAEGHFARHLRRMRLLYAERRGAMLAALEAERAAGWQVMRGEGGLQVVAKLALGVEDRRVVAAASRLGLEPSALSDYAVAARPSASPGLVLGFANLPAARAGDAVRRLAAAIEVACGSHDPP